MTQKDDCIGIPGFAGFVPQLSTKFGSTYGNATRSILHNDPSLRKGVIQREYAARVAEHRKNKHPPMAPNTEKDRLGADARFSFPPVPGYTGISPLLGYIARSRDHFGRGFVETTKASLAEFQRELNRPISQKLLEIQAKRSQRQKDKVAAEKPLPAEVFMPAKTHVSGYTGFVPRLQNHFGETYSSSVRGALKEFSESTVNKNPYCDGHIADRLIVPGIKEISTRPIPGFTGFIPGARAAFSQSFGNTAEKSYRAFNNQE